MNHIRKLHPCSEPSEDRILKNTYKEINWHRLLVLYVETNVVETSLLYFVRGFLLEYSVKITVQVSSRKRFIFVCFVKFPSNEERPKDKRRLKKRRTNPLSRTWSPDM